MTPTREEFLALSSGEKMLFYVLVVLSLAAMVYPLWVRAKLWRQGRALDPIPNAPKVWLARIVTDILGQRKVRSSRPRTGSPMHLMIFYGFLALLLATTLLAISTYSPIKFHQGTYYLAYEMTFDLLGLLFMVGVAWAFGRRLGAARAGGELMKTVSEEGPWAQQRQEQRRFPLSHAAVDLGGLALLFVVGLTGYLLEGARMAFDPKPWDWSAPVGYALSPLFGDLSAGGYRGVWWVHTILVLALFVVIPHLRLRHIVLAVASTAGREAKPMGKLDLVPMERVEETGSLGAKTVADLSRWQLLSMDACMECGRCTEVCPALNAGKLLNPKQIVQDVRHVMERGGELAPRISDEALWQCTTCNACVEACPVHIRHVDVIVDARRNLVFEGALSGSAATMLRQTESTSHAWGQPANAREDWMKGLDIPLCRDKVEFEFLFWVGCAGATDPGAVRTTKAVAELLKKAGVKFACLGKEEACTGDPARRIGEELLFQDKAGRNVDTFRKYSVKKVVTACPHCFNTLRHEYGDLGYELEVFHHTQLLAQLVRKGDLLAAKPQRGEITFHDPCYLGRVNEESASPRELLGDAQVEPEFHGVKTRCCGAGGGRMWMEEPIEQRPSDRRAEQLLATGAKTVAVGCPFCRIMLDAGLKQKAPDGEVQLLDVAEVLLAANAKEPRPGAASS